MSKSVESNGGGEIAVVLFLAVLAYLSLADRPQESPAVPQTAPKTPPAVTNQLTMHSIEGCGGCRRWEMREAPKVKEATGAKLYKETHSKDNPDTSGHGVYPWFEIWNASGERSKWVYSSSDPWLEAEQAIERLRS